MLYYVTSYPQWSFLESQYRERLQMTVHMQHQGQKKIRRKARGVCDFQACGTGALTQISANNPPDSSRLWFKASIASGFTEVSGSITDSWIVYFQLRLESWGIWWTLQLWPGDLLEHQHSLNCFRGAEEASHKTTASRGTPTRGRNESLEHIW